MIYLLTAFFHLSLVSQDPAPELPPLEPPSEELPAFEATPTPEPPVLAPDPSPSPSPSTGADLKENFEDPFANPAPENLSPTLSPEPEPLPAAPAPVAPSTPSVEEPKLPEFKESDHFAPPTAPDGTKPLDTQAPRPKPFEFPNAGQTEGPVTQNIVEKSFQRQKTAEGTWSLTGQGGGALNVNRAQTQLSIEIATAYRFALDWDLSFTTYFRAVKVKLLGFLLQTSYFWRLTDPDSFRIELGVGGGFGWTLRAASGSFNESRFPARLQVDTLFYASPKFAVVLSTSVESFLLGLSKGKNVNMFKGGGPPTQAMGHLGVRFQF